MSAERTLTITLDMLAELLRRAAQQSREDLADVERAAGRMADATERAATRGRDAQGRFLKVVREDTPQAFGVAAVASDGFAASLKNMALQAAGIQSIGTLAQGIKSAFDDARRHAREVADEIIRTRADKKPTTQFVMENMAFEAKTGFRPDESRAFLSGVYGSGNQYIGEGPGRNISAAEAADAQRMIGQLAVIQGLDPENVGDLAGKMFGARNYTRFGDQAGEQAAADFNRVVSVLGQGAGDPKVLAYQLGQLGAGLVNEDPNKGIFRSYEEAAIATSAAAELSPAGAMEIVNSTALALRDTEGKQGATLKKAGITREDDYFAAVGKLAGLADEAAKQGVNTVDFLQDAGFDVLEARGLATMINKGIGEGGQGVFQKRRDYAAKLGGIEETRAAIADAQSDIEGPTAGRLAEAQLREARARAALPQVRIQALRDEAAAQLTDEKAIDTSLSNARDFFADLSPAHQIGVVGSARDRRINTRVAENLAGRLGEMGVDYEVPEGFAGRTPEAQADLINQLIDAIEARGGKATGAGGEAPDPLMREQTELLRELVQQGRDQGRGPLPAAEGVRLRAQPGRPGRCRPVRRRRTWRS